jgi:DNA-binding CsgD family transcriptional regulator
MTDEIIGREHELSAIQAFLDHPVEGLTALVLEGDAGIGKSTLWQSGVTAARERSFRVLGSSPAEAERTLPFVVLGDLFSDIEPAELAALPGPRRRAFEAALVRSEQDDPVDPLALGVAIQALVAALAADRPLVLAIDDDQWMDPSSAATLRFALRRSLRQPVVLFLSRRLGVAPATRLDQIVDQAGVGRLRVGALSAGAIQLLLRRRLGYGLSRPRLLRLHEASGGNPFYALELARAQSLDPELDATAPLAVPPSLEGLVAARLQALDSPTRWASLLVAANGRLPTTLLRPLSIAPDAIDQAVAANVLERADGVIRFTHPLLASALYQGASSTERRVGHRLLATVFDDPVDRGRHLALGADAPDDALAAAVETAVSTARERGMAGAVAELAEHALRLTPVESGDDRDRRAAVAARAQWEAGDGARARAIAADLLRRAPSPAKRAEALLLGAYFEDWPGNAFVRTLESALAQAKGAPALEAAIHAGLADGTAFARGRAWAEPHARVALRLAEGLDDEALRASALATLASLRFEAGDPDSIEMALEAHRLAAASGSARSVNVSSFTVGYILAWSALTDRAREWLEGRLEALGSRDERARSQLLYLLAVTELWAGRWTIAAEVDAASQEVKDEGDFYDPFVEALVALHRGQLDVARHLAQAALSSAGALIWPVYVAILAICDAWSGNPAAALESFERAEHLADLRGWDEPIQRWWRVEHVEALLQLGRIEDAARLVEAWQDAARINRERVVALAGRCRGLIAAARGDLTGAQQILEEAMARHEAVGDPFGRARAALALGSVRRRARKKRAAREALDVALAGFESLGAASWAAATRREIARIGGRQQIAGLSPSEARVAELVTDGFTNREIASALFVGERTVASHLTHIYGKLGIRSRTELARALASASRPSET